MIDRLLLWFTMIAWFTLLSLAGYSVGQRHSTPLQPSTTTEIP